MKKITIIAGILVSVFLFSCNNQTGDTDESNNTPAASDTAVGIVPDSVGADSTRGDTSMNSADSANRRRDTSTRR